ncbi:MAG: hypothetical protein KDI51_06940 [Xanthomonadales bacterium]|nr:hypothetical protein [Xanthomonadales bacterium]
MVVDAPQFAAALTGNGSKVRRVPFLYSVEAWLMDTLVPEALRTLIAENSYSSFVEIGPVTVAP